MFKPIPPDQWRCQIKVLSDLERSPLDPHRPNPFLVRRNCFGSHGRELRGLQGAADVNIDELRRAVTIMRVFADEDRASFEYWGGQSQLDVFERVLRRRESTE